MSTCLVNENKYHIHSNCIGAKSRPETTFKGKPNKTRWQILTVEE